MIDIKSVSIRKVEPMLTSVRTRGYSLNSFSFDIQNEVGQFTITDTGFKLIDVSDGESVNPIQDFLGFLRIDSSEIRIEAITRFLERYGVLNGYRTIREADILRMANHVYYLIRVMNGKTTKNSFQELIQDIYLLYTLGGTTYFTGFKVIYDKYQTDIESNIQEFEENVPVILSYDGIPYQTTNLLNNETFIDYSRLTYDNCDTPERKCEKTKEAIDEAVKRWDEYCEKNAIANPRAPMELRFLNTIYKYKHFFISGSEEKKIIFIENVENIDVYLYNKSQKQEDNIVQIIDEFASQCIRNDINHVISGINWIVDKNCTLYPNITNLLQLLYYSLTVLDSKALGYYPCSNPKCNRYVLRKHPGINDMCTVNTKYDVSKQKNNKFCCQKCGARYAQKLFHENQRKKDRR